MRKYILWGCAIGFVCTSLAVWAGVVIVRKVMRSPQYTVTSAGGIFRRHETGEYGVTLHNIPVSRALLKSVSEFYDANAVSFVLLDDTSVSDDDLKYLSGLLGLQTVSLNDTQITGEGLAHLSGLLNLETLRLNNTRIGNADLKHFETLVALESLELNGTDVTVKGYRRLRRAVPGVRIYIESMQMMESPELRTLKAGGAYDSDLEFTHLNCVGTKFSESQESALGTLTELIHLNCSDSSISNEGLSCVVGMAHLKTLHLDGTGITDAGLKHVVGLDTLDTLSLARCRISDDGLAHVASLPVLRTLTLSGTDVTDAGLLEYVAKIPQLRSVYVSKTKITDEGIRRFKERRNVYVGRSLAH